MTLVALSNAITPKTTGPVVELTGQTLQGAVRDLAEQEGLTTGGLLNSRYLTTYGVAFSPDGLTVYVGEAYKNRVLAVDVALGTATTVAGGNRGLQDGSTHSAKFSWPYGVAMSPNGNTLYVADSGNDCIRAISLDAGMVSTIAGGGAGSRGFQDGLAAKAKFAWPYGVATSPDGHTLYVADSGNNRIRSVDLLSGLVGTLAGAGVAGYQDGAASAARFYGPRGVVASPDGSLVFVADYSNFRVRTLELAQDGGEATVSTLFGGKGEIYRPAGVAVTGDGRWVLAADSANAKVRGVQLPDAILQPPPHHPPSSPGLPPATGSGMGGVEMIADDASDDTGAGGWRARYGASSWVSDGMGMGIGMGSEIEEMHIRHAILAIGAFVAVALLGAAALVTAALYGRRNALRELSHYQSLSKLPLGLGGISSMMHQQHSYAERDSPRRASYEARLNGEAVVLDMPLLGEGMQDHVALDMGMEHDHHDLMGMDLSGERGSPPGSLSSGSRSPIRSSFGSTTPPRGYNPLRPGRSSHAAPGEQYSSRERRGGERETIHVVRRTTSTGLMAPGEDSHHRPLQHQRSVDSGISGVFRRSNY